MTPPTIALEASARACGGFAPMTDLRQAESLWSAVRVAHGFRPGGKSRLITLPDAQHKVGINARPTWSLALAAGRDGGMCVNDLACRSTCVVDHGGKGDVPTVRMARAARTAFLITRPDAFAAILARDVEWAARRGIVDGRPNANSDAAWEILTPWLAPMVAANGGRLYDYTKRRDRVGYLTPSYRVTYSATRSTSEATVRRITAQGDTVTVVLPIRKGDPMPASWRGIPVVDGDLSDDRFSDPAGCIVGLRAKGALRGLADHPLLTAVA